MQAALLAVNFNGMRADTTQYPPVRFIGSDESELAMIRVVEARGWRGSIGTQYYFRDFDAFGAEAYVPKNETDQIAFFTLQEIPVGPLQLELAGRYEKTDIESQAVGFDRGYDTFSGAA